VAGLYRVEYFQRGDWIDAELEFASREEAVEAARALDETTAPQRVIPRGPPVVEHDTGTE
jgi:hypothetical protein